MLNIKKFITRLENLIFFAKIKEKDKTIHLIMIQLEKHAGQNNFGNLEFVQLLMFQQDSPLSAL